MSNDRYENIRKVLAECRDIAMEWTLRGRIPECGKFGEIAQDLDAVCAELAFLASAPVSVPMGWKLVPIEPTPEMLAANGTCELAAGQQMLNDDARKTWRAMLEAAPQQSAAVVDEAAVRRVIAELRAYNPAADEYKGAHIHKVWARELTAALAAHRKWGES